MKKFLKPITVDFETFGIEGRPKYPPVPSGVSVKYPGKPAKYYSWGHLTDNNCSISDAKVELEKVWKHPGGILFQNAKFDIDVAEVHLNIKPPTWDKIHDTMFLLFLDDPHQTELSLKPASERILGLPPEERDEVLEWLVENQPIPGIKISKSKASPYYAMKYLPYAPGKLVGKYANGDVERTELLFNVLYERIVERGMLESYQREQELMPILLETERRGLHVDHDRLNQDVNMYRDWQAKVDQWIIKTIKGPEGINLDSGPELMGAMIASNKVDPDEVPRTKTGKYQTNKEALLSCVNDKKLLGMLKYRAQLKTCMSTFMESWLKTANKSGGFIFTNWNQVKSPSGDSNVGTRTGRLSSTPNFQNIPKEFTKIFRHEDPSNKKLPECPLKGLPKLPYVRSYITAFKDHVLIDRDYSQQEPRILAHFDGGDILRKYLENPWIDFHDFAQQELAKMGLIYDRKPVKNTNLGLIYGMGVATLAEKNDMAVDESKELKKSILKLYPGLAEMYKDMKIRAKNNQPIRTWGGREYYCEPPKLIDGRIREFDYKMVNVLVQGSAADCTKQAIINFYKIKPSDCHILINVHDQITVSSPKKDWEKNMELLREAMESVKFDVPMLSEGSYSAENWGALIDYDKKGKKLGVKNAKIK